MIFSFSGRQRISLIRFCFELWTGRAKSKTTVPWPAVDCSVGVIFDIFANRWIVQKRVKDMGKNGKRGD